MRHDAKEIKKSIDESREGLEDFGRVVRDYTLLTAFVEEKELQAEFEEFSVNVLTEIHCLNVDDKTVADIESEEDHGQ